MNSPPAPYGLFPASLARLIAVWLLLPLLAQAQPRAANQQGTGRPIPVDRLSTDNLDLRPFTQLWVDTASRADFSTIVSLDRLSSLPAGSLRAFGRQPTVWLRVQLYNPYPTDTLRRLFFGGYHHAWALGQFDAQNRRLHVQTNGWLIGPRTAGSTDPFTLPITVPPGQHQTLWFRTTGMNLYNAITPRLFTRSGYEQFRLARSIAQREHFGYYCLIIGICLFLSLFAGFQALYARDITNLYWSLYLAVTGLFFFLIANFSFNLRLIGPTTAAFNSPMQFLIEIAYLLFLRSFLKLKTYLPRLDRLILILIGCLFVVYGIGLWGTFSLNLTTVSITNGLFVLTQLLLFFIFARVSRAGVPNRKLFIIGSLALILMSGIANGINELGLTDFDHFQTDPIVWFSVGVVVELLFFNLALSQRSRLAERDKQRLITESALENQRLNLIAEQFRQRIAQTEMAALRSQMNPHFIFNCLNSIQYFTAQNDAEKASDYLTKFSRLIRLVLENSKSERVTLANELETLRLYIEMEAMRFQQKVHYVIEVAETIDTDSIQMPPLLLQPFVENAIWHGLMHKEEGGTVHIAVQQPAEHLLHVEITDDGVGRQKATEYKSKSATRNKSFGMKMTAERIELINQLYHTQTQVAIIDLVDTRGQATGTKIVVEIPV